MATPESPYTERELRAYRRQAAAAIMANDHAALAGVAVAADVGPDCLRRTYMLDLLHDLAEAGVKLSLNGDRLRITPASVNPELVERIRAVKTELVERIARHLETTELTSRGYETPAGGPENRGLGSVSTVSTHQRPRAGPSEGDIP